jgi:hypothetical protein
MQQVPGLRVAVETDGVERMRKLVAALLTLVPLGLTGAAHAQSLWAGVGPGGGDEGYVDAGWGYPAGYAYAPGYVYSPRYAYTPGYAYQDLSYPTYEYVGAPSYDYGWNYASHSYGRGRAHIYAYGNGRSRRSVRSTYGIPYRYGGQYGD